MRLLRTLTLGYLAVLVGALAASLIAILVELRRIGAGLGEVGAALTRVRDHTTPLGGHLQGVQDASVGLADVLMERLGSRAGVSNASRT